MIDFVRIQYRGVVKNIVEENLLNQPDEYYIENEGPTQLYKSIDDSVCEYPKLLRFENLNVKITNQMVFFEGSLHRYYNILVSGDSHNYNDFTYSQLVNVLNHISTKVIPLGGLLTTLEFGFNIHTELSPKEIINSRLFRHGNCKNTTVKLNSNMVYKEFSYTNYDIKIYDKSRQYRNLRGVSGNILRAEIRMKAKEFQKIGLYRPLDLINKKVLRKLFMIFLKQFEKLVIIDPLNHNIPTQAKDLVEKYMNTDYAEKILGRNFHTNQKARLRDKIENIISNYNLNQTKECLKDLLKRKYVKLINN